MENTIGQRVLAEIDKLDPPRTRKDLAQAVGMTEDAFSRAINGKRSFSSLEITLLADELSADLHWLITGETDPNRVVIAARHAFDTATMERSIPTRDADQEVLEDIWLAYTQAYLDEPGILGGLPKTASDVREVLSDGFVRHFIKHLDSKLEIDAVRVAEISAAYSFTLCGRRVVVVPAVGNWFHENWSLAHELGHLVLGHHESTNKSCVSEVHEAAANAFAAELLMPAAQMHEIAWGTITDEDLAATVWDLGVSTTALAHRLRWLGIRDFERVEYWSSYPTQRLLRRHGVALDGTQDEITIRMDQAAQRSFPLSLQERHIKKIATGELGKQTLAWMVGVDPDRLEVDSPAETTEMGTSELAAALGL